jgi:hypothetical protein
MNRPHNQTLPAPGITCKMLTVKRNQSFNQLMIWQKSKLNGRSPSITMGSMTVGYSKTSLLEKPDQTGFHQTDGKNTRIGLEAR